MFRRRKSRSNAEVHYVKGSKIPAILVIAVVVLSIVLGVKLGSQWQQRKADKNNHHTEITSDVLHQEIEQIGELATVNYYYTNMGKFEDTVKLMEHDIPFTKKSFILSYDGVIKAGIDLSMVEIAIQDRVIVVTLPESKIISHEVDLDSAVLYDEKNSIFNGLSAEDVTGFINEQQKTMEEKALHNGLLEKAQKSAIQVVESFLHSFVDANQDQENPYELQFQAVHEEQTE